jgi:hypothetical protein
LSANSAFFLNSSLSTWYTDDTIVWRIIDVETFLPNILFRYLVNAFRDIGLSWSRFPITNQLFGETDWIRGKNLRKSDVIS